MVNRKVNSVLAVAGSEYIRWVTDPRVIIVPVLLVFMQTLVVEPLLGRAAKMGGTLGRLEPFVAIGNSGMLLLFLPCVFLVLISDYPQMSGNTLFALLRTGKRNWYFGQLVFLMLTIGTYLGVVFVGSLCMTGGSFLGEWSDVVTKYNAHFPAEATGFDAQLIPSNLYNQIPLKTAVLQTIVMMYAYLFLLALIIYLFRLHRMSSFGILAAVFVIAVGMITYSLGGDSKWLFPMANTLSWLHYDVILNASKVPFWYSPVYFGVLIGALLFLNRRAAQHLEIDCLE